MNDDEEQLVTRVRISALIAGIHGVNVAEDDEVCSGAGITDEWLSSWYPETHMSQKMVIGATRKEMERFKRLKVYLVLQQGNPWKGTKKENDHHQVGHYKQRY